MFTEFDTRDLKDSKVNLESLLKLSRDKIDILLGLENKTFENFMKPYQEVAEKIGEFVCPIFHIDSVCNSEETKKVQEECIPLISIYETELGQNENIYKAIRDIQCNYNKSLTPIQNLILENELKDFTLQGCSLEKEKKEKLKVINIKLSEASNNFSQNLIEATNAYEMVIENFDDVKEIPKSDLQLASFKDKDGKEKYRFTLQSPSYISYMTYGTNRDKRKELNRAYTSRASNNEKVSEEILSLEKQRANLLGFKSYAQLSIEKKMAKSCDEVLDFLNHFILKANKSAKKELGTIKNYAKKLDNIDNLQSYDLAYYSQKYKKEFYDIDEEFYRQYFEEESMLEGFFEFLSKFIDISFIRIKTRTWDEKVKAYDILDGNKKTIARIYLDLEARKNKRAGAWMNDWCTRYKDEKSNIHLPSAFVVCNFPPSKEGIKSLLRHSDVVTFFHEMGHALHHLLSQEEDIFVSGVNGVSWDVIEFPSQFLEYFAYEEEVLKIFAKHNITGEVLDDESIKRLKKARNFQSAMATLRQVEFALFDFELFMSNISKPDDVQKLLDDVRAKIDLLPVPAYNKFQNGFSHIFAGGYSAGYYSYKWAEVLSADAFYCFLEKGIFCKELANKYKNIILAKGGSGHMDELFYEFANKNPNVDSLLKIDEIIS